MRHRNLAQWLVLAIVLAATAGASQEPKVLPHPATVMDPPWLKSRQQAQLETVDQFSVFHGFRFTDKVLDSGIDFRHRITDDSGKYRQGVHYSHGNSVNVADVDGDGHYDVFFTNQVGANQLFRSQGDGTFTDITGGLSLPAPISVSAAFADIDNDGDPDVYVTTVREGNVLYENDGAGGFTDVAAASGLDYKGYSSAPIFFDYDRDGMLDVFLCNIGTYTTDVVMPSYHYDPDGTQTDYVYYVGYSDAFSGHLFPERYERSRLYHNLGDNRFADVSDTVGIDDVGWTGDATPLDANEDGWPDLYVMDMQGNDQYYENVGGTRFDDRTLDVFPRSPWGAMGIKVLDYDNDGHQDLFLTDMHSDMSEGIGPEREKLKSDIKYAADFLRSDGRSIFGNALLHSLGPDRFEEVSDELNIENYWPWGVSAGDLNADGFDDAMITGGMNYPWRYAVNTLLLNNRGEKFLDSEFILGIEPRRDGRTAKPWFELDCSGEDENHHLCEGQTGRVVVWGALASRSSAFFDLDEDGDLDIITNEFNAEPMVLISDLSSRTKIKYLMIRLVGSKSNRDGLGAMVSVEAGGQRYTKVHDGKSGYIAQSSYPLYFGLGSAAEVQRVEVRWPSGSTQEVAGPLAANQVLEVREP